MSIPEFFIRRAVTTTLMMAGLLGFGLISYRSLPVSDLPNVDFPTISITASLPGASPETMASSVATPLERQFSTIAGVDSMTSTSLLGSTQVTIQFVLDRNIDAAAQDVQSAISKASRQLPNGMPAPPSYQKVNPADQPILYMALSSPTLPLSTVDEYAETLLAQRISMVDGVAQVAVFGSQKYAVRIQVNPDALATRGIGVDEVEKAIQQSNVNLPTGTLFGTHQAFTVQANGQLMRASDYRPMIVAYRNGNPVRLAEIARVIDSVENDKVASWFDNDRAIVLAVQTPARHEHRGSGGRDSKTGSQFPGPDAGFGETQHGLRPVGIHPRFHPRREDHSVDHYSAGDPGDFFLLEKPFRHHDSEPGGSHFADWHVRIDVLAELYAR